MTLCGGYGDATAFADASPEAQGAFARLYPSIKEQVGEAEPLLLKTQVVAGLNYSFKLRLSPTEYAHAVIYQPLGDAAPQLSSCSRGHSESDTF